MKSDAKSKKNLAGGLKYDKEFGEFSPKHPKV